LTLLLAFAAFTILVSFLCSLLEAALLSTPSAALRADSREKSRLGIRLLLDLKARRIDDALSAILIVNTVANTLGAVMVGAQARSWATVALPESVDLVAGVVAAVLTLMILTCSEIVPKTLGAVYARQLAPFVGVSIHGFTVVMTPVLFATRALTGLLTRGERTGMTRGELTALIHMATEQGVLKGHESQLYRNLLRFDEVRVADVMTPRTVATMLPVDLTIEEFLATPGTSTCSRIPVYGDDRDDVKGYVLYKEILRAAVDGCDRTLKLEEYLREGWFLPELVTVGAALREFQNRREPVAVVTDEHGGVSGLVTLEDLVETVLGVEILDESDVVPDLRKVAEQIRDERLAELARRHSANPEES